MNALLQRKRKDLASYSNDFSPKVAITDDQSICKFRCTSPNKASSHSTFTKKALTLDSITVLKNSVVKLNHLGSFFPLF